MEYNDQERMIFETFRRFAVERVRPLAEKMDEEREFPRELFRALGELGAFGLRYPVADGGSEVGLFGFCIACSEIARESLSLAAAMSMQALMGTHFLHKFGSSHLHQKYFAPALRGEKIGTICITEPNAGSDLSGISTSAQRVDGGYSLNGQKTWITSAPVADFFTVFARIDGKLSIFLVAKEFEGLVVGRAIEKMGCWGSQTSEVSFSDCFVPHDHRLGDEGAGEKELRKVLDEIRIMTGALAVGVADAALEASVRYSEERVQFDRPIKSFQAIQLKLAEMATDLEASRLLVFDAARKKDQNLAIHKAAAMAKLFASERAVEICDKATRIFGAYGFAMEYPVQRYFRDIRFTLYGGGTSEILKTIIAKELK